MTLSSILDNSSHLHNEIINFVDNRPVLIVGSSKDISHIKIDFPVVVRINSSRRWGDCDIWFNNYCNGLQEHYNSSGSGEEKYVIRGNGDREGSNMLRNYPPEWHNKTLFWHPAHWETMVEEIEIPRPLTGTIATYWFHKYTNSDIFLLNFDFYRTVKTHTIRGIKQPAPCHNPELDENWIASLDRIQSVQT